MRAWADLTAAQIKAALDDKQIPAGGVYKDKGSLAAFAESVLGPDPDHPALVIPGENGDRPADDWRAPTVVEAMGQVMRAVSPIAKSARNMESHYAARGIDDVMGELHGHMADAGVLPVPMVEQADYTARGKQNEARLRVRWRFYGPAGDYVDAVLAGEALDSSDKATNKALQATLKYLLLDVFLIPVGDADADTRSPSREEPTVESTVETRAGFKQRIDALPPESRAWVATEWSRSRLGALLDEGGKRLLTDVEEAEAEAVIGEAERAIREAADSVGLAQDAGACPECGAPADAPHQDECSRRPL